LPTGKSLRLHAAQPAADNAGGGGEESDDNNGSAANRAGASHGSGRAQGERMSTPVAPTAQARWKSLLSLDNRYVPPVFITFILLVGHLSFGILESLEKTALAIGTAIVLELALGRIFYGKWPNLASAYISGISVGILIRSPAFWPFALCSAISIVSKYVLRIKGRHLWNPSNFGICAMLFLAGDTVASLSIQWGNYMWPMLVIWALGSIIIYRLKRFHITATYVIAFVVFALLRSVITGSPWQAEIAPITGPMYQLFIFFMITDPRTTVRGRTGQCIVAFIVALVEMILRLNESVYAPYYALFMVGPTALLLEMWRDARREAAAKATAASH
jgi:Na+-translocating ferredoxin:NAD+ oxidoreductase RnfD subunit